MTTTTAHPVEKKAKILPPGPQTNFFVGNMHDIQHNMLPFLLSLRQEYGDIVRFRFIWNAYAFLISSPTGADHILRIHTQNYRKGIGVLRFKPALGEGLLTSEGSFWKRQRRLAQPAFHRQRIAALAPLMTGLTEKVLERWQAYEKQEQPFDVSQAMMSLTFQIVAKALFNADVENEIDAAGKAFTGVLDYINYTTNHMTLPERFPTRRNRRFHHALGVLDTLVNKLIQERRRDNTDLGDLLSMFMLAHDEDTGESMSDQQLRDEVMTMMTAGHETTANTLTWTWYLLAQHPNTEEKLHDELDRVLSGRVPTLADLANLPYTKMVIEESLRLYPPAWGISRSAIADDEIGGYAIPAGSELIIATYVTHRHPDYWDEPEKFDPERFTSERSAGRPHFAYLPFGGGPRLCIGNSFAVMEAQLILATIAQLHRLRLATTKPVIAEPLVTLRPRGGMPMIVEKRK